MPGEADARLISRRNLAPGRIIVSARLRRVGVARARSESSETPSYRRASSFPLAAALPPREPTGSATARLDEVVEHRPGTPLTHRFHCGADAFFEIGDLAC